MRKEKEKRGEGKGRKNGDKNRRGGRRRGGGEEERVGLCVCIYYCPAAIFRPNCNVKRFLTRTG